MYYLEREDKINFSLQFDVKFMKNKMLILQLKSLKLEKMKRFTINKENSFN